MAASQAGGASCSPARLRPRIHPQTRGTALGILSRRMAGDRPGVRAGTDRDLAADPADSTAHGDPAFRERIGGRGISRLARKHPPGDYLAAEIAQEPVVRGPCRWPSPYRQL